MFKVMKYQVKWRSKVMKVKYMTGMRKKGEAVETPNAQTASGFEISCQILPPRSESSNVTSPSIITSVKSGFCTFRSFIKLSLGKKFLGCMSAFVLGKFPRLHGTSNVFYGSNLQNGLSYIGIDSNFYSVRVFVCGFKEGLLGHAFS
jgi:hypothetical protein